MLIPGYLFISRGQELRFDQHLLVFLEWKQVRLPPPTKLVLGSLYFLKIRVEREIEKFLMQ